jgi:UDP-N-acetylglucosamine acyltransferase
MIHPTAIVDPTAKVPASCQIGPFCRVGPDVEMGEDCELISHVVVEGPTRLGSRNRIFPFAVIGMMPQDLKFHGEATRLEVGDDNQIRESVTIHRGTVTGLGITRVGSHCLIMAYAHIAHDCVVGDYVIMGNAATLAGHVTIEDHVSLGAFSPVHQFVTVGKYCFVGGGTVVTQDVLPFSKVASRRDVHAYGANVIGLERRGFSPERIRRIQHAYKVLLASRRNTSQALEKLRSEGDLGDDVAQLIAFIERSQRGVIK